MGQIYDRRATGRLVKQLDEQRKAAVEQLKQPVYFHRQATWLQERFPEAELADVPGLVKLVNRKDIEAADWSLTPGRYVGVAPHVDDEDFDFEQTLRAIHIELADLGIYDGPHATPKEADDGPIFLGIKNLTENGFLDFSAA